MFVQIENNDQKKFALFNLGFRPLFLFASFSAIILIAIWLAVYSGWLTLSGYYQFINWHSHEMLFGYSLAVIAGFLLTAVTNWTGLKTIDGTPLAVLSLLWIAARLLPFVPVNGLWIAISDLLFSLLLTISVAIPIIKAKQWHNLSVVGVLFMLFIANLLVHLQHLGFTQTLLAGNSLAIYSILMLLIVITGRVVPFFTRVVVEYEQPQVNPVLENFLLLQLVVMAMVDIFNLPPLVMLIVAFSGAIAHIIRVWPWFDKKLLSTPVLWVLYAGYLWLIIGFVLQGLAAYHVVTQNIAIHAWTTGGIALLTYGMMARVTLGHTGRNMIVSQWVVAGFAILFVAAIVRVIMPIFFSSLYLLWIQLSSILWIVAFIFFVGVYTKMYFQPRVDGRQG
ncbi:MAG: NnrS family protein [Pseudomonadota bacterium]